MKLFLSAASNDFRSCRSKVAESLRPRGIEVDYQEEFLPDYGSIHKLLSDKIRAADGVVCLIGRSYGGAPRNQPFDPPRSFTQLEYYIAQELQKPIFLFVARPDYPFDEPTRDPPVEHELQRRYAEQFATQPQFFYPFSGLHELLHLVDGAVHKLQLRDSFGELGRSAERHYPTPLASVLLDCVEADEQRLGFAAIYSLRFLALLAAHDALLHGAFAAETAEPLSEFNLWQRRMERSDWRRVLRLACPGGANFRQRFVPEFAGWEQRQSACLDRMLEILQTLSGSRFDEASEPMAGAAVELRAGLKSLFASLDFLQHYALAAVQGADAGTWNVRLFRGLEPRDLRLRPHQERGPAPAANRLYLLSLDRRSALPLLPALWHRPTASLTDVWGCMEVQSPVAADGHIAIAPFSSQKPVKLKLIATAATGDATAQAADCLTVNDLPRAWLDLLPSGSARPPGDRTEHVSLDQRFLADESWDALQTAIMPVEELDPRVGGFRCFGEAVHRGRFADIFEAVPDSPTRASGGESAVTTKFALHRLRKEHCQAADIRAWFARRAALWQQIEHSRVLPLDPRGDAATSATCPFLACDFVAGSHSLEQELNDRGRLDDAAILAILTLAAEVCLAAGEKGLRVLALPPRHFLADGRGGWRLTGFDTLLPADCSQWCSADAVPLDQVKRWSSEWSLVAPEAGRPTGELAETIDVYALGVLLCRLRGSAGAAQPRNHLPLRDWSDPWNCLAFHCLATQPEMRIQTVEHFLRLLPRMEQLAPRDAFAPPSLVEIPAGPAALAADAAAVPAFRMADYPITNAQFAHFCEATRRPLPLHLAPAAEASSLRRLAGPWSPVVFVSLEDAAAYCRWLSHGDCGNWRLPTEADWLRAARLDEPDAFPWGHEPPSLQRANFGSHFRGPTVIGACAAGRSASGCYDQAGNVWEWCLDRVHAGVPQRVLKGGAYDFSADALELPRRQQALVLARSAHVGFRVLCEGTR